MLIIVLARIKFLVYVVGPVGFNERENPLQGLALRCLHVNEFHLKLLLKSLFRGFLRVQLNFGA